MKKRIATLLMVLSVASFLAACTDGVAPTQAKKNASSAKQVNALQNRIQTVTPSAVFDQARLDGLTNVDLAYGGLIFDKFWVTGADGSLPAAPAATTTTNLSWPATNTAQTGANTWRCVACHGWDYAGVDGKFGDPGSPFYTGLRGIISTPGGGAKTMGDTAAIFDVIDTGTLNGAVIPDHNFGPMLADENALYAITYFVRRMQGEAVSGMAPQGMIASIANADQLNGYNFYMLEGAPLVPLPVPIGSPLRVAQGGCAGGCHGADGTGVIIHASNPNDPKDVATYSNKEPFEVLHKVRFGHLTAVTSTNAKMPGLEWYSNPAIFEETALKVAVDVLAFSQNGLMADHARGGRLFDSWVKETGGVAPAGGAQPLMAIRSSLSTTIILPEEEWLCSTCHGFDYTGTNGFRANLLDLKQQRSWNPAYLYSYLKNGRNAWIGATRVNVHNFGATVPDAELWNLAEFLMEGVVDTRTYISSAFNGTALGEGLFKPPYHGQKFFAGNMPDLLSAPLDAAGAPLPWACNSCHGDDGKSGSANIDLTLRAWEAPWRFFHRVRFGMPGSIAGATPDVVTRMPGLLELVLSNPMDPAVPMAEEALLPELTDRVMDIQTFAQDSFVLTTPPAVVLGVKAAAAQRTNALKNY